MAAIDLVRGRLTVLHTNLLETQLVTEVAFIDKPFFASHSMFRPKFRFDEFRCDTSLVLFGSTQKVQKELASGGSKLKPIL